MRGSNSEMLWFIILIVLICCCGCGCGHDDCMPTPQPCCGNDGNC